MSTTEKTGDAGGIVLYHGTSFRNWRVQKPVSCLYLTDDKAEAENYGEEACSDEEDRIAIFSITVAELLNLGAHLGVDDGCQWLPENAGWRQSLASCHGICVENFSNQWKAAFRTA